MTIRSLVIALSAVGLCGFGACEATVTVPSFEDEDFDPLSEWEVDPSNDIATAFHIAPEDIGVGAATAGTVFTESIYPKFDDDFWRIPVAEPGMLIQVRAQYNKNASPIRLAVDWIGPRDLCTPSALTTCTSVSDCTGMLCDASRGGCRSAQAAPCADDPHCGGDETCRRGVEDGIATVIEAAGTMQHLVLATLPAHVPGDYYIRVYDRDNTESDANVQYELQVGMLADPDVTEMNDAPNMATPVANGDTINGFFSYRGDVDYYRIDPGADAGVSTAAVTSVEVRWASGADSEPSWTIEQLDRQFVSTKLPSRGTENVHGGTFVLPTADPILIRVENTGDVDTNLGYEITINVIGDPDEGTNRNDTPQVATPVDMTSFGTSHNDSHTVIAENDLDWYRIDRSSSMNDNSLMYLRAQANSDDIMMGVVVFEPIPNMGCDPSSQLVCGGGQQCVCPISGTCSAGQGVCLRPWVTRPLANDPNHPPEFGGRTPNDIQLQLPIFDSDAGSGALWVQVGHLQQVFPPRAGFSTSDSYSLTFEHRQEPHAFDRSAGRNEFQPLPLGVSESTWVSNRRVQGTFSLGETVSGYLSYEGDQDWFRFTTSAPVGMADLHFSNTGGMNLRVQVRRGGNRVGNNGGLDASSVCSHMYSGDSTIDVWVNDNDFNEWNISTPYSFTLNIVPGCNDPPCHLCRCHPETCGDCGNPPENECGVCDGSIEDLGCGCGNPADQGCGCGNPGPVDGSC